MKRMKTIIATLFAASFLVTYNPILSQDLDDIEDSIENETEQVEEAAEEAAVENDEEKTSEPLGIGVGLSYRSKYYWRGQWFYGAGSGVFFPYISYSTPELTGDDSIYLYVGGEVGEGLIDYSYETNESGFGITEKDWAGIDYGAVYSKSILEGKLGISAGAWYYWYFQSEDYGYGTNGNEADGIDNSFVNLAASISLKKVFLAPTISYSQYYRMDPKYGQEAGDVDGDGIANEKIDPFKDIYVSLSGSHSIELVKGASLLMGGSVNYWHYASKEFSDAYKKGGIPSGISDITLMTGITTGKGPVSFTAKFNYGFVVNKDFDYTTEYKKFDQNKFWTSFNVHYSI